MAISHRYIADRFLPDKAIDLIDEAGSKARIEAVHGNEGERTRERRGHGRTSMEQMDQWRQLKEVSSMKEERIREGLFEEASLLRARELEVKKSLVDNGVDAFDVDGVGPQVVDVDEIEAVAAAWSGIRAAHDRRRGGGAVQHGRRAAVVRHRAERGR